MVVFWAKGIQQPYKNILPQAISYITVRKQTVIRIQEMKKEHMEIMKQKRARMENDISDMNTRNNPDPTSGTYLTAVKLAPYKMVAENMREKEEAKKET